MAYDSRQLKTFKWLESIAKESTYPIMVYCGSFYATDRYMLAKLYYQEFYHLSDWEWSRVTRYFDDDGYLLKEPKIELMPRQFTNNRIFDDMFIDKLSLLNCKFDPKFMRKALKVFEINRIKPNLSTSAEKIQLTGHNDDVSIKVVFMGVRSK